MCADKHVHTVSVSISDAAMLSPSPSIDESSSASWMAPPIASNSAPSSSYTEQTLSAGSA